MKYLTSAQNPTLKHFAKLLDNPRYRKQCRQTVLEGVHLLQSCLNVGYAVGQVIVPENKLGRAEIQTLLDALSKETVCVAAAGSLSKISALTEAEEIMTLINLPEHREPPTHGDCVVLDQVQDPGNVGTMMRSTAAAGIRRFILGNNSADVWSPKVLRAAMGAHFLLDIFPQTDLNAWRQHYRETVRATALSPIRPHSLYGLDLTRPCAWIFGNEGSGVSDSLLQSADQTVTIPMIGQTESLNVAMAATVCLFEQMRQRLPESR